MKIFTAKTQLPHQRILYCACVTIREPQFANSNDLGSWDLFRISRARKVVDLCPNTLRAFAKAGLPVYRMGRATFVSKTELAAFIRARSFTPKGS